MAHILRFTDGTNTLKDLNDGATWLLEDYLPAAPDEATTDAVTLEDGGERPHAAWRNVNEPATCVLMGANAAALQAELNAVQRIFMLARRYQQLKIGTPVYLEFQPDGASTVWRSEVLGGKYTLTAEALGWQWRGRKLRVTLAWTRRYYWEGAEATLTLTNGSGSGTLLTTYNHDDGDTGHDNWVHIAAGVIAGDLPAPARIEMTNSLNDSARTYNVYVAHNVQSNPASLAHIIEGESATLYGTPVSPTADAGSSGGYCQTMTVPATEGQLCYWTLSTALLNACAGNYFEVLARLTSAPDATMWLRLKILMSLTALWEGPIVNLANGKQMQDLGALQLPPYLVGSGDIAPLTLQLCGKNTSGSTTLALDYLQLTPLDGFRKLKPQGYGMAYGVRLVDDMIARQVWSDGWSPSGKTGHYAGQGAPIMLSPGEAQRLYFLMDGWTGDGRIDRTLNVTVKYRPRRLLL